MNCAVSLSGFEAFRSKLKSASLLSIADHWQEARGTSRMPRWSDLRPAAFAAHLTRIWSYRYDRATGEFSGRLAGNRVIASFGVSFRGTPLREVHPPHIFDKVQASMTRLVLGPCLYRGTGQLFRQGDHVTMGERIALPLAEDGEHADGILGVSDYPLPPIALLQRPAELILDREEWFSLAG